jgi:hypothetical protein
MTHLFRSNPHPCQALRRRGKHRPLRKLLLIPVAGLVLACASCADPGPPPPTVTDTAPVGEGLKVIGYALLGAAVVGVLGRILK